MSALEIGAAKRKTLCIAENEIEARERIAVGNNTVTKESYGHGLIRQICRDRYMPRMIVDW